MTTLHVGLDSWIISDGNYPDFQAGQEATFALTFHPTPYFTQFLRTRARQSLELAAGPVQPHLQHQGGAVYAVGGRVVYADPQAWVCDFGVLACCSNFYLPKLYAKNKRPYDHPPWAHVGASVTGEVYLSIDPFNDAGTLRRFPGIPPLVYRFRVERIWLETTPWVQETDDDGRPSWWHRRQDGPQTFRQIAATGIPDDASSVQHWFSAQYVLECQLLAVAV